MNSLTPHVNAEKQKLVREAFDLANEVYEDVRMKSGKHYMLHLTELAIISVKELGLATSTVIAAFYTDK